MKLSEVATGAHVVVTRIDGVSPTTLRLMELGFTVGAAVEVVRRAPFGDPLEVRLHGTRICLRTADAAAFVVDHAATPRTSAASVRAGERAQP